MIMGKNKHTKKRMITQREKLALWFIPVLGMGLCLPITAYSDTGIVALSQLQSHLSKRTAPINTVYKQRWTAPSTHQHPSAPGSDKPVAEGNANLSSRIESAMRAVSKLYRIPFGLLHAISLTESGIDGQPWPWTLNVYGVPYRFSSAQQTKTAIQSFFQRGIKLVDIGPMQVDWQYHHHQFGNVSAAVNPLRNVAVAGRILKKDFDQTGSWRAAIGLYHGGGEARQSVYIHEVFSHWDHAGEHRQIHSDNSVAQEAMATKDTLVAETIPSIATPAHFRNISSIVALVGQNHPIPQKD